MTDTIDHVLLKVVFKKSAHRISFIKVFLLLVISAVVLAPFVFSTKVQASQSNWTTKKVFAFYYSWYKNPTTSGVWAQWQDYVHTPPNDISSTSYPVLGAYDSTDSTALWWHMLWLSQAKVDVLLLSWWGIGSSKNGNTQAILDAASQRGIKVAFMIDSYPGRTAATAVSDISYIYQNWGSHPAFFRASRATQYGNTTAQRGVFYIYALDLSKDPNWPYGIDYIHNTAGINSIILAEADSSNINEPGDSTWIQNHINATHADGVFNYAVKNRFDTYYSSFPESNNWIVVPATAPGFDSSRAHGNGATVERILGAYYDSSWWAMADKKPEWVSIVSFNEWHETSQIEPAIPKTYNGYTYKNYEGHYGYFGVPAYSAYLVRTAYWSDRYRDVISPWADQDSDGFNNVWEEWIGSDPQRKCPVTTTANDEGVDAWPPDVNDDRTVNSTDVNLVSALIGQYCGSANFNVRYDLNPDCVINSSDVAIVNAYLNQTCTP